MTIERDDGKSAESSEGPENQDEAQAVKPDSVFTFPYLTILTGIQVKSAPRKEQLLSVPPEELGPGGVGIGSIDLGDGIKALVLALMKPDGELVAAFIGAEQFRALDNELTVEVQAIADDRCNWRQSESGEVVQ